MARLVRYHPNMDIWNADAGEEPWLYAFFSPFRNSLMDVFAGDNLTVDLYETEEDVVVKASLPGVNPEDIEVNERQGVLTIRARNEEHATHQRSGWLVQERRHGDKND